MTAETQAEAQRKNVGWRRVLGSRWPTYNQFVALGIDPVLDEASVEFAVAISVYQERHGMAPDGVLSPEVLEDMLSRLRGSMPGDRRSP